MLDVRSVRRALVSLFGLVALVSASVAIAPLPVGASVFTVVTNADSGAGSLRQAFDDAEAAAGGCDIGSVEVEAGAPIAATPATTPGATPVTTPVVVRPTFTG